MSSSRAPAPTPTTLLNQKRASPTLSEPVSLITPPASVTKSIASRYSQAHNQQNTDIRLPATNFQIQVDFQRGLWGFCSSDQQDVGNCWMPGICFDEDKCKDGCGNLDRKDLGITTCTSKDASICATAYLTLDNGLGPFQYINCLWLTTTIHYTASQADAASNPAVTTTSSGSSSISLSSAASTLSTPSQTIGNPSSTDSKGDSTAGNNNNNNNNNNSGGGDGSNSNIGAIVGGVIGGIAIICTFVFAAYLVWIYRIRDRRKQQQAGAHVSEPLNGNGSGRSSEDDTPTTRSNLPPPLSYSPDGGQPYGGPSHHGQGYDDVPFGRPMGKMGEIEQRTLKDAEGGWGPRELDSGFERGGGFAHEQQQGLQPGQSGGPYEVLSVEEVAEMPVRIEPVELSSGWEEEDNHHHGRDGGYGHGGGGGGTEMNGGGRRT